MEARMATRATIHKEIWTIGPELTVVPPGVPVTICGMVAVTVGLLKGQ